MCPALDRDICAVCCGTKRETEIRCPESCGYLSAARAHPPVQVLRRQTQDFEALTPGLMGLSEPRQQLYLFTLTLIDRFRGDGLDAAVDADVTAGLEALAASYDTASRGILYEQQAPTAPGQRLAAGIRGVFDELGRSRPTGFAADAAEVLRRLADRAREVGGPAAGSTRTFLDLAGRVARRFGAADGASGESAGSAAPPARSGLIIP